MRPPCGWAAPPPQASGRPSAARSLVSASARVGTLLLLLSLAAQLVGRSPGCSRGAVPDAEGCSWRRKAGVARVQAATETTLSPECDSGRKCHDARGGAPHKLPPAPDATQHQVGVKAARSSRGFPSWCRSSPLHAAKLGACTACQARWGRIALERACRCLAGPERSAVKNLRRWPQSDAGPRLEVPAKSVHARGDDQREAAPDADAWPCRGCERWTSPPSERVRASRRRSAQEQGSCSAPCPEALKRYGINSSSREFGLRRARSKPRRLLRVSRGRRTRGSTRAIPDPRTSECECGPQDENKPA